MKLGRGGEAVEEESVCVVYVRCGRAGHSRGRGCSGGEGEETRSGLWNLGGV